jgi:energy-coupling factor transporter ATP-binding protein EcfA2
VQKTPQNSNTSSPAIELRQATFTYIGAKAPIWENLSCTFDEGKINVIAGPSGCGKSTLLQAIDGLVPHVNEGTFTGWVLHRGSNVTAVEARLRCENIGYVMQDPESQFCTFTVEEEVAFGPENLGIERDIILTNVDKALTDVGLAGFQQRSLSTLSSGQKQKVAIASVLAMEPQVLLLDEPTANLDPASRREVLQTVAALSRTRGITIIMVEHNLEDIMEAVDKIVVLDAKGNVAAQGSRPDVVTQLEDPQHEALRAFLPPAIWGTPETHSVWKPEEVNATGDVVLQAKDVTFAYPLNKGFRKRAYGPPVLDGISLQIRQDDFVAVVGRNGVGKSTLFKVIFRLYEPQSGSVELLGRDMRTMADHDIYRTMGLVFQNPELQFVTNQVDEELIASLKNENLPDDQKRQRVHDMLVRYGLADYATESPFILSQGQKRRLSVATMLLTNQKLLFLDEPTYGQDHQNCIELMDELIHLNRNGIAIAMITHDEALIRRYAKRVICIKDGRVAFDGSVKTYLALSQREGVRHV